ncbi:MAG: hypothetical protein IKX16_03520 [Clostridia bacterium]|nr:hypothetical protein [Clostridia bacterium]
MVPRMRAPEKPHGNCSAKNPSIWRRYSSRIQKTMRLYHLGEQYDRPAIEARYYKNYDYNFENTRRRYDRYMDAISETSE